MKKLVGLKIFFCFLNIVWLCTAYADKTSTQLKIEHLQTQIIKTPNNLTSYIRLSESYIKRGHETGDVRFFELAEQTLRESEIKSITSYQGKKLMIQILLGKNMTQKALKLALELNKECPDDVHIYGWMCDAYLLLGEDDKAADAAQWMINLLPGNVPGLIRAARIRAFYGDTSGGIEFMLSAYDQTPHFDQFQRAECLVEIAQMYVHEQKLDQANAYLNQALHLFPNYYRALDLQSTCMKLPEETKKHVNEKFH